MTGPATPQPALAADGPSRWLPYLIAALLAWGTIADPLITVTASLPLVAVTSLRIAARHREPGARGWWGRLRRGTDGRLLAAGIAGFVLARAVTFGVGLAGGFSVHGVSTGVASPAHLGRNLWMTLIGLAVDFGVYLPDMRGPAALAVGAVHLVGLVAVLAAAVLVAWRQVRALRAAPGAGADRDDLVTPLLAVGILANVLAFALSSLPVDALSARQIVSVLPLGAALAGRVYGPRVLDLGRLPKTWLPKTWLPRAGLAVAALVVVLAFGVQSFAARPVPPAGEEVARWLDSQRLAYGLGGYWNANVITLTTGGRVQVAPVSGAIPGRVLAYRWESRADWFDPARHDARFLVVDLEDSAYGQVQAAAAQFGPPVSRRDFGRFAVLRYDRNLLVGLPALCRSGRIAPSMAQCAR